MSRFLLGSHGEALGNQLATSVWGFNLTSGFVAPGYLPCTCMGLTQEVMTSSIHPPQITFVLFLSPLSPSPLLSSSPSLHSFCRLFFLFLCPLSFHPLPFIPYCTVFVRNAPHTHSHARTHTNTLNAKACPCAHGSSAGGRHAGEEEGSGHHC